MKNRPLQLEWLFYFCLFEFDERKSVEMCVVKINVILFLYKKMMSNQELIFELCPTLFVN